MILALDWDDTITEYTSGCGALANNADELHIVTLNSLVDESMVFKWLGRDSTVHIMPSEAFTAVDVYDSIAKWKTDKCIEIGADLMVDDLQEVVDLCNEKGVPAIQCVAR